LASRILAVAGELVGMDFATQEALDSYLKEHPDADRSNHRVVEKKQGQHEKATGGTGLERELFEKNTKPLRKKLSFGDRIVFLHGGHVKWGVLHDVVGNPSSGDLVVIDPDGKKYQVSREHARHTLKFRGAPER
jgi:hypothetical protein